MKAVILAAGVGSRLNEITKDIPKTMIQINGRYIFSMLVDALVDAGITSIVFVIGYKKDLLRRVIEEELAGRALDVTFVVNDRFQSTNTMYSLWLAREHLDCDFAYFHGDLVFSRKMLRAFLASPTANAVLVDQRYPLDWQDAMKVIIHGNELKYMSKAVTVNEMDGTAIGIYKFSQKGARELFGVIGRLIEKGVVSSWVSEAMNIAAKAVPIEVVVNSDHNWADVDNMTDLRWGQEVGNETHG
jgi:L-glutamine-phosphate cytidylyltransferase